MPRITLKHTAGIWEAHAHYSNGAASTSTSYRLRTVIADTIRLTVRTRRRRPRVVLWGGARPADLQFGSRDDKLREQRSRNLSRIRIGIDPRAFGKSVQQARAAMDAMAVAMGGPRKCPKGASPAVRAAYRAAADRAAQEAIATITDQRAQGANYRASDGEIAHVAKVAAYTALGL